MTSLYSLSNNNDGDDTKVSRMSQYGIQGFQNNYGPRTLRRKSLLIGINYEGQQSALQGCRQDVRNMVLPTTTYLPTQKC